MYTLFGHVLHYNDKYKFQKLKLKYQLSINFV